MSHQQTELWKNKSITERTITPYTLNVLEDRTDCTKCELHEQATSVCVPTVHFINSLNPKVDTSVLFILGQNPGFHEDQQGIPFVGRGGNILKEAYIGGCKLHEKATIYLGNGVRCFSDKETPKPRHFIECNQYTIEDLKRIQPDIVLTLGAQETTSFYKNILGVPKISLKKSFSLNGNYYSTEQHKIKGVGGFNVFSTFHPSAVIRNNNHINSVHSHMELLSDCLDGTMATPSSPVIVSTRSPNES